MITWYLGHYYIRRTWRHKITHSPRLSIYNAMTAWRGRISEFCLLVIYFRPDIIKHRMSKNRKIFLLAILDQFFTADTMVIFLEPRNHQKYDFLSYQFVCPIFSCYNKHRMSLWGHTMFVNQKNIETIYNFDISNGHTLRIKQ